MDAGAEEAVIGAINGACVGMGFTLRSIRTFGSHRTRRGWDSSSPSADSRSNTAQLDAAAHHRLAHAMELAVTGRLVDAQEALRSVWSMVVPHDKLMETAREVADTSRPMLSARRGACEKTGLGASVHRPRGRDEGRMIA